MKSLLDYDTEELRALMAAYGQKSYRAAALYKWLHSGAEFSEMTDFPQSLREKLAAEFYARSVEAREEFASRDGTVKYLFASRDGELFEGVLMSYTSGRTLCVSSQIGCRMGCVFCASGADGLGRDLTAGEILGQVTTVNERLGGTARDRKLSNLVLMGSGEPLDNYANVTKFLRLVTASEGLNMGARCISLSTCGLADKIRALADDGFKINLTVSLHSPDDAARAALMPVNRAFGVSEVMAAARYYFDKTGRRVTFEYTLIRGFNDRAADAAALRALTRGLPCHVNLILLNSPDGRCRIGEAVYPAATRAEAESFKNALEASGIVCTVRRALGSDIGGACGQLRSRFAKTE